MVLVVRKTVPPMFNLTHSSLEQIEFDRDPEHVALSPSPPSWIAPFSDTVPVAMINLGGPEGLI